MRAYRVNAVCGGGREGGRDGEEKFGEGCLCTGNKCNERVTNRPKDSALRHEEKAASALPLGWGWGWHDDGGGMMTSSDVSKLVSMSSCTPQGARAQPAHPQSGPHIHVDDEEGGYLNCPLLDAARAPLRACGGYNRRGRALMFAWRGSVVAFFLTSVAFHLSPLYAQSACLQVSGFPCLWPLSMSSCGPRLDAPP